MKNNQQNSHPSTCQSRQHRSANKAAILASATGANSAGPPSSYFRLPPSAFRLCGAAIACAILALASCSTTGVAHSPIGAAVITKTANSVIDKGLNAGATKIDNGNPFLHSLAVGLRANEGKILTADDVKKIAADYGDPANQHKFKSLALNVWAVIKNAAVNIGWSAATELAAQGLQKGAVATEPLPPPLAAP